MATKKLKRNDTSTWLAYGIITWAVLLGTHYAVVEKEHQTYRSCAAELSQNKECLTAMRRLYATTVAEKMQQKPEMGTFAAVDAAHRDLTKRFSEKNNADALFVVRAGDVIQKELTTLCAHTTRWEFTQILAVYPYVDETQFLWEKSGAGDIKKRIGKYQTFAQEMVFEGLKSRSR